jgi:hypothetical protein
MLVFDRRVLSLHTARKLWESESGESVLYPTHDAPRIGVIAPDQYQQMMGWQIDPPRMAIRTSCRKSSGFVSFDAAHDSDAMLRTQLEEFNTLHHRLPQQNPIPASNRRPSAPAIDGTVAIPTDPFGLDMQLRP